MKQKGFTIVESLVAITILSAAIIGAMAAAQTGLSSYIFSKDQVVAFYLAQSGFEQLRNIRDENRLTGAGWLTGIAANSSDPCYFGNSCTVSPVESAAPTRCSGACPVLRQNEDGFYGYDASWAATPYTRTIELTSVNEHETAVTVTVSWSKGIVSREFTARENLFDW